MDSVQILKSLQFLVDDKGRPCAVQIGITEWKKLLEFLEDQEDRAVVKDALRRLRAGPVAAGALAWEKIRGEWDAAPEQNPKRVTFRWRLLIEPEVHALRKDLPGHVRQRVKRAIEGLAENPRPPVSRVLDLSGLNIPRDIEVWRLRIERWRVVYAVNDKECWVWILAIRRRPPYDYADLGELVNKLE